MQCDMVSNDVNVSPVIDIDRVSAILTTNRIDDNVTNFATDGRVKIAGEDPNSATYVTKNVGLAVPATGLKVMFSANSLQHRILELHILYSDLMCLKTNFVMNSSQDSIISMRMELLLILRTTLVILTSLSLPHRTEMTLKNMSLQLKI